VKGKKGLRRLAAERHLHPGLGRGHIQLKRRSRPHLTLESDFDPLLTSQIYDKAHYRKPSSGEERLAWRYLERNVLDVCQGTKEDRLTAVKELMDWIEAEDDAPYSFSYWCSLLGVDEGYMLDNFWAFLLLQGRNAEAGIRGDFKILRQIEAVRIEQPHTLSYLGTWDDGGPPRYRCLSCGHIGDWEHFLGYTCVRGQEQSPERLKRLYEATAKELFPDEESNSQPLNASNIDPLQDQGSGPDHELDNWASDGGRTDAGGPSGTPCVGAVAAGPAPAGSAGDVQGRL